jgi:hypothetical protein
VLSSAALFYRASRTLQCRLRSVRMQGPDIDQASNRRVRSQASSYRIYGEQRVTGGGFSPSSSVSAANSHSTNCFTFINHPIVGRYVVSILTASLNNQK